MNRKVLLTIALTFLMVLVCFIPSKEVSADTNHNHEGYTEWTSSNSLPTSGSYYLSSDVTISSTYTISSTLNLCLNGHNITKTGSTGAVFHVNGSSARFNLYECNDTVHYYYIDNNNYYLGKVVDSLEAAKAGNPDRYGSFTGGYITGGRGNYVDGHYRGGCIVVNNGAKFNFYGGTMIGNCSKPDDNGGSHGAIWGRFADVLIHDGAYIIGNYSPGPGGVGLNYSSAGGTLIMDGGVIADNTSKGNAGGIGAGTPTTITGGKIFRNVCLNGYGGGISVDAEPGKVHIGGNVEIAENTATAFGGGVCVMGVDYGWTITSGALAISGSPNIHDNYAKQNGETYVLDNLSLMEKVNSYYASNTNFTLDGPLTEDANIGINIDNETGIVIKDWATYMGNADPNDYFISDKDGIYILLNSNNEVVCVKKHTITYDANGATSGDVPVDENGEYLSGSQVTVLDNTNLTKTGYAFGGWNTKADGSGTTYSAGSTFTIEEDITLYALWLHSHDEKVFNAWTSSTSLPTSGSYYLTTDVTISSTCNISSTLNLCLNGHGIRFTGTDTSNGSIFNIANGKTLNLYDCEDTEHRYSVEYSTFDSKYSAVEGFEIKAGMATVDDNLTEDYLTFTGGYLTGGIGKNSSGVYYYGGAVYIVGGTFNMYGGTLIGNTVKGKDSSSYCSGAGVYVCGGTFNMYAGKIMFNSCTKWAGGLFLGPSSTSDLKCDGVFNMYGGSFEGNVADDNGGAIFVGTSSGTYCGRLNIDGAQFKNNFASGTYASGGAMLVQEGVVSLKNTLFSGNVGSSGGTIRMYPTIYTSSKITNRLDITGCVFENNIGNNGAALYLTGNIWDEKATINCLVVNIEDTVFQNNTNLSSSGVLYFDGYSRTSGFNGAEITMTNCQVKNNTTTYTYGGVVGITVTRSSTSYNNGPRLRLVDCEITGNFAKSGSEYYKYSGVGISVYQQTQLELSGRIIIDNNKLLYTYTNTIYDCNLYIGDSTNNGMTVKIVGELTEDSIIGVTRYRTNSSTPTVWGDGPVTSGLSGKGSIANFYASNNEYYLTEVNGDIRLNLKAKVIYNRNSVNNGTVPNTGYFIPNVEQAVAADGGTLAKKGYEFVGWNTAADGSGILYRPGDKFDISGDITLYAVFEHASHNDADFILWSDALALEQNGSGKTASNSLPSVAGDYFLGKEVTISSTWIVPEGKTNLCLNGYGIKMTGSGSVIYVGEGADFTLDDCGENVKTYYTKPSNNYGQATAVTHTNNGTYNYYNGGYITGGTGTQVYEEKAGALACYGGGVYVLNGKFTMNGGIIIGNTAQLGDENRNFGGGVAVMADADKSASFTMSGGYIVYNKSGCVGGGIAYRPWNGKTGDVTVSLYGGYVTNNEASSHGGGVFFSDNEDYGTINIGGMIYIYANYSHENGGGLYIQAKEINLSGRPSIYNNTSSRYDTNRNNLMLFGEDLRINIVGELESGANIWLTWMDYDGTKDFNIVNKEVTNNWLKYMPTSLPSSFFKSDNSSVGIHYGEHGEVANSNNIYYVIYLDNGNGVLTDPIISETSDVVFEESPFTFDKTTIQNGWIYENTEYAYADSIHLNKENVTIIALVVHTHSWSYELVDGKIVATCSGYESGACPLEPQTISIDVTNKEYDGNEIIVTLVKSEDWKEENGLIIPEIYVSEIINAGTHTASIIVGEAILTLEFTISRKALTITVDQKEKIYGDEDPEFTYQTQGLLEGDTIIGSLTRDGGNDAGTYAITQGTLSAGDNYDITYVGANLTINKKNLVITAKPNTIVYGDKPANDGITCTDFATGENETNLTGELVYEYTYNQFDNVGSYEISVSGLRSDNYDITFVKGILTVSKKALDITPNEIIIIYGGLPINNGVTYNGFAVADDSSKLSGELVYEYTYNQFDNVGLYEIIISGLSSNNYDITFNKGILKVEPKELTITVAQKEKVYGKEDPELTYESSGLINEDAITGSLTREEGNDAGTYAITQGTLSAGDNYVINYVDANLTITPKEVSLEWNNLEFAYDGETHKPIAMAVGLLEDDECEVVIGGEQANAGSYTATATSLSNANYKLGEAVTKEFVINKIDAKVTTKPQSANPTYNGNMQQLLTIGEVTGGKFQYAFGIDLFTVPNDEDFSDEAPQALEVGTYYVWYKVAGDSNHNDVEPACIKVVMQEETWTTLSGVIYQKDGLTPIEGATIKLTKGNKEVDYITSDQEGKYQFIIPTGLYNIVVEHNGKKDTLIVSVFAETVKDISLLDSKTESVLVVNTLEDKEFGVIVGGLDQEAYAIRENDNLSLDQDVKVEMTVEVKTEKTAQNASSIVNNAKYKDLDFFEIQVKKIIDSETIVLENTTNVLEIAVPYSAKGRKGITVYSYHGSDVVLFEESETKEHQTFRVDEENGIVYIYSNSFSTFAIGYTPYYELDGKMTLGSYSGLATVIIKNVEDETEYKFEDVPMGKINFTGIPKGNYIMTITWNDGASNTLTVPLKLNGNNQTVFEKADNESVEQLASTSKATSNKQSININYLFDFANINHGQYSLLQANTNVSSQYNNVVFKTTNLENGKANKNDSHANLSEDYKRQRRVTL